MFWFQSSSEDDKYDGVQDGRIYQRIYTPNAVEHKELVLLRKKAINESLNTIRSCSSAMQNHSVFSDLVLLQNNLLERCNHDANNLKLQQEQLSSTSDKDIRRNNSKRNISEVWYPLAMLDVNADNTKRQWWPNGSKKQLRRKLKMAQTKKRL
jgi:hypothetical protein